jgi:hypothetical protein
MLARARLRRSRGNRDVLTKRDEATKDDLAGMERLKKTSDLSCLEKDRPDDQSR